jgi:hypothetical protein
MDAISGQPAQLSGSTAVVKQERPCASSQRPDLTIIVLFDGIRSTLAALRTAARLADGLSARIRLLVPHVVPYPLPLERPSVPSAFLSARFRTLAEQSAIDTDVDIRFCRNAWEGLLSALPPHSLIVVGNRPRWWPTRSARLAERLRREGHSVVLASEK